MSLCPQPNNSRATAHPAVRVMEYMVMNYSLLPPVLSNEGKNFVKGRPGGINYSQSEFADVCDRPDAETRSFARANCRF